jgi:hypothetical protein
MGWQGASKKCLLLKCFAGILLELGVVQDLIFDFELILYLQQM